MTELGTKETTPILMSENGNYEVYWERLKESARYHPANRYRYHLITSRLLSSFATTERPVVLDMGCGDGTVLRIIGETLPEARLVGCDLSQTVVDINQSKMPRVSFFCADISAKGGLAQAFKAESEKADAVVCSEVIEHVENDYELLKNANAALKPGGVFLLTTQSGPLYRVDRELLHHLRHYELEHILTLAKKAGFEVIESFCSGFPVLNLQKMLVDLFFDRVMKSVASSKKPSWMARAVMATMFWGMCLSPKLLGGPQLFLCLRKSDKASKPS